MACVVSVHRVGERDAPAVALDEAQVRADFGLEADWRSRQDSDRQITLIEAEALVHTANVLGLSAVPSGASRRQVVVSGVRLNDTVGKRLRVGPVVLEITDRCDPCRNMERKIGRGAMAALTDRGGVCARVREGGVIRPGDAVVVIE